MELARQHFLNRFLCYYSQRVGVLARMFARGVTGTSSTDIIISMVQRMQSNRGDRGKWSFRKEKREIEEARNRGTESGIFDDVRNDDRCQCETLDAYYSAAISVSGNENSRIYTKEVAIQK